jgi:DNA-binding NtrC family response regulator
MTTVLLVDDEQPVLRSLEKTLLRARFHVLTANNCLSGWEMFQAHAGSINIAIFDLNMPDFDNVSKPNAGLDLVKHVLAARPDLPVLILTAYDEVSKARGALQIGARAYFIKGREQGLVDLVQEVLFESFSK